MKKLIIFTLIIIFTIFTGCNRDNISDEPTPSGPKGIFTITDDPSDKLSVLSVELTELKIVDTADNKTIVFSETENDETFVLNLLNLEGVLNLLGSVTLSPGTYKKIVLSFKNAQAADLAGNALTVVPEDQGTLKILLNPHVEVESDNVFFELDFDVRDSVHDVVKGKNGRVELRPTVVVKVEHASDSEEDPEIEDFKGEIESVQATSLVVSLNDGNINVNVTENTIIEIDEVITTFPEIGSDLTTVFSVGESVEIDGPLDTATNTITADKIERKWSSGSEEEKEFRGIVVKLDSSSFDVLVLDVEDSGFSPGSTQTVIFDGNTLFLYDDPSAVTSFDNLSPGQDVAVTGELGGEVLASRVKLKETKIIGTVASVGPGQNQVSVNAESVERVSPSKIQGFNNPFLVDLQESNSGITSGDKIEVEGHFNRAAPGIFLAAEWEAEDDDDDDEEEVEVEGEEFSIKSTNPLIINLTGEFEELGFSGTATIQVVVASGAAIIEESDDNKTIISRQALIDGINGGRYEELEAEGIFDQAANTLTAKKIKVEVKEEEDD